MPRQKAKSYEGRFLGGACIGAVVGLLLIGVRYARDTLCFDLLGEASSATCAALPPVHGGFIVAAVAAGIAWSAYRAYRDYGEGEYYADLVEAGDL